MRVSQFCFLIALLMWTIPSVSQTVKPDGGGSFNPPVDFISEEEKLEMRALVEENSEELRRKGKLTINSNSEVTFGWPIKMADHVSDYGVYGLSNFVDLNSAFPNQLQDYMCGTRTYDLENGYNHAGIDIFNWPNTWLKMDNDDVEIVAAAPGTIVAKLDGNYDRNCSFVGTWNAVYVRHIDGSTAFYGHMKNGSLTEKEIGESVEEGEYLGVVGSSGQSTGPHLHFEVHDADGNVFDPYKGSCSTVSESSWKTQKPYYESRVNAVRTHDAPPEFFFNSCNTQEVPNYNDAFLIGEEGLFATYYQDQLQGQVSFFTIYDADLNVYSSWNHSSNEDHYQASYWYWTRTITEGSETGVWEFRVNFNGNNYSHNFTVSDASTVPFSVPLVFPTQNEMIEGNSTTMRWLALADADSYDLQISYDSDFNNLFLDQSNLTNNERVIQLEESGIYYWRARAKNEHGTGDWSSVGSFSANLSVGIEEEEEELIPVATSLEQNYPNPFNPNTTISFTLTSPETVSLKVFDLLGREISTLASGSFSSGRHTINFDASNIPSGVYIYSLSTSKYSESKKMLLLK